MIGATLNERYKLLSEIHHGGGSIIYQAAVSIADKSVAIKILHPGLCADSSQLKRFLRAAKITSMLAHPCFLTVYDFGLADNGQPYLVMELLEGQTIQSLVESNGPLMRERFQTVFVQLCNAMAYCHASAILHRDLKPSHFFVTTRDDLEVPVILDFRIGAFISDNLDTSKSETLTQDGEILGTPLYMSPEQTFSSQVKIESDIYSMGCSMYFALTGEPPFHGANSLETMQLHRFEAPPKGKLTPEFESIIQKCLEKEPEKRFGSMLELAEALKTA